MATVSLKSTTGKWIMASVIMASAMGFIDSTALNVVLPALQKSLDASGADLFWILNAYLLMLASLILVGGSLGDKLGRKKVFMTGIFVFIIGSVACGSVSGVFLLIVFRAVQGIGGALMIPGSLSLISSAINADERGKAIGTWSAVTTLVTVGGPILGGALGDAGLWRYIFFINVPIGIIALIILWRKVSETSDKDTDKGIDYGGSACIALGLAALTFGFLRIPVAGFNALVIAAISTGILLLLLFVFIERRSKHPVMPLQLFKIAAFSGTNLLTFFLYAGLAAGMLFLSLNLVQVQGYSQLQSGLTFLPFTILMISLARFAGSLADKFGAKLFLVAGPAIAGLGLLLLSFIKQTNGPADYWSTFFPYVLVFGLGMSFTVAPLTATVMGSVSDHFSGVASGVNNAMTRIANVFANAIFGALAVLFYSQTLQGALSHINLNSSQKQTILKQAADLGNAKVPKGINGAVVKTIEAAYHAGFIHAYANIMRISALLAFLGALMALLFVQDGDVKKDVKK